MKTRENEGMVNLDFIFFQQLPFLDIYFKNQHIHFLGAWSFFLIHIRFTPSEESIVFVHWVFFIKNQTMEVGPSSRTMKKCHLPWSNLMVHGVNWRCNELSEMVSWSWVCSVQKANFFFEKSLTCNLSLPHVF